MTSQPERRAKAYTDDQQKEILKFLDAGTRYPLRNKVIFLLSTRLGLRAGEIAQLCWHHVLTYKKEVGDVIRVSNDISKGMKDKNGKKTKGGRELDMPKELIALLKKLYVKSGKPESSQRILLNHLKNPMTPNAIAHKFYYWFKMRLHWEGFSSHSGRRTFITKAARNITQCGGSIYDVCRMAGHTNLDTTQKYIEGNREAQKKVINML